jgi:hypothetical protein
VKQEDQWDQAPDPVDLELDLHLAVLVDREALVVRGDPAGREDLVAPEDLDVALVGRVDSRLCLHFPK